MARRAATVGGARKAPGRKVAKTAAKKQRRRPASVAELRAQTTAASRVLELIGKSPSDLQPVFDAIAESARDLTGATYCSLARLEDGLVKIAANCGWKDDALATMNRNYPRPVGRDNPLAVAILDGAVQNVADILDSDANYTRGLQAISGYRSMLVVPIMRDLSPVGAICIFSRKVGVFQQRHINLLKTFAAQAVIAIENTRLFNEVQTKTRDLEESLQQQTATADVLKVISRSTFDLQAALTALVEAARELCNAQIGTLFLPQDGVLRLASQRGCPPDLIKYFADNPLALDQNIGAARAFRTGQPVHLPDVLAEPGYGVSVAQRLGGWRSLVAVPLLRGQEAIGVFSLSRTGKPEPFTQRQIDLLNTFADQAVIAIENARLFNETQESLQQQTATAEVLQIISDSPGELQPVFEAVLQKATRICDARFGSLLRFDGNSFYFAADVGTPEPLREYMRRPGPFQGLAGGMIDRIHATRQVQHSADYAADAAAGLAVKLGGARSTLGVPILREDELVGAIVIYRQEVRPFSEREIELVRSFASQAAIAIENARLFNETKQALERQSATADILKVIASSPDDAQPVFEAIASSARRLIGGFSTAVHLVIDDMVHLAAFTPTTPEADEILVAAHPRHRSEVGAVALVESGKIAQLADSETADPHTRELGRARGWRSVTLTPLMNQGSFIGFIASTRREPGVLADHQLELLRTFADQAVIAIENVRLFDQVQARTRDLEESLQQQTATADVLRIISRSVAHAAPVFDTILESCQRLFKPYDAAVYLVEGDRVKGVARRGPGAGEWGTDTMPLEGSSTGMAIAQRRPVHFPDLADKADLPEDKRAKVGENGGMTVLYAPMISQESGVGSLVVTRQPKKPFTNAEIGLIQTFADQAVIAIENARLFNETKEALERQTATSDILRVISQSPTDVQPVFEAIAQTAVRLLGCDRALIQRCNEESFWTVAWCGPDGQMPILNSSPVPIDPAANFPSRAIIGKRTLHLPDWSAIELPEFERAIQDRLGIRSALYLPLLRHGECIGLLAMAGTRTNAFAAKDILLAESFRDQALIAIENVRLFDEVQAKTRDLTEALAYQTGSGNVLRVIASSPTDINPVLEAIVESARELCESDDAVALLKEDETLRFSAHSGPIASRVGKWPISRNWTAGRAFVDQKPVHVHDMLSDEGAAFPDARAMGQATGAAIRTVLSVPLLRGNESIGAILLRRTEVSPFNDKQIALLSTFADQAVIAIQNARLFNETREALERQTATSDILNVIASSPTDTRPVFEAIASRAKSLVGGFSSTVFRFIDGRAHLEAFTPTTSEADEVLTSTFPLPAAEFAPFLMAQSGEVTQIADIEAMTDQIKDIARARGFRSMLFAPLMNKGVSIGLIVVTRTEPGQFAEHHVQLLRTFADQAVIAIENVRLFDEVQAKTRDLEEALQQQTATADVLRVISRSTFDLQVVLNTLVQSAVALCDATACAIYVRSGDSFHAKAFVGENEEFIRYLKSHPQMPGRGSVGSRVLLTGEVQNIADVQLDDDYEPALKLTMKARAALGVPLKRDGTIVGAIVLARSRPEVFNQRQIELTQTYADQAVIAIENVRLFENVEARTRELAKSLEDLRTAQDRLVQTEKLASLGQLTAGIAHEIKNPLNFVNNFSALSTELTDELRDVLAGENLTEPGREQVDELTGLLKDNLGKVVQHGKRADSIVKNMLQHSREGSGERRSQDLNALVSESLNLAYHGARAERSDFNITLEQDLDPDAGAVEVYPQDITRALLNLFSNGFYAAISRKKDADGATFEPVLSTATRRAGDTVEIRIRDNGTGIPAEIREKIFNPFFTTKPTGEGTGLGLSMTHDIIVKQHGGRIDLESKAGAFTEFTITLPRAIGGTKRT